jgi:hypothetical protein
MPYQPAFMQQHDAYLAEKAQVRTVEDWARFSRKWFDATDWPEKTQAQLDAEAAVKRGPVKLGRRLWGYGYFLYDLTPEARCEYLSTLATLGDAIRFPPPPVEERYSEEGWEQRCLPCEIATSQLGGETCPRCGGALIYIQVE